MLLVFVVQVLCTFSCAPSVCGAGFVLLVVLLVFVVQVLCTFSCAPSVCGAGFVYF